MIEIKAGVSRPWMRVTLIGRIHACDFSDTVMPAAERLRERDGRIGYLVLDVRRFHGWSGGGTFAAQIRFLHAFGRSVERVAVFGPPAWSGAVPAIAALFVAAEVRSFTPGQGGVLRRWLRRRGPSGGDSAPGFRRLPA